MTRICDQRINRKTDSRGMNRTLLVVIITSVTMGAEIVYGILSGSMALLADGIHMGTHTFALLIAYLAYRIALRNENNSNFAFSSGKVKVLGGYTNAILLGITALFMIRESVERFINPHEIHFNQALLVAVLGLAVNIISAIILSAGKGHNHDHDHAHDHNLKAAFVHVLTDAMTSILAIAALLIGKIYNYTWPDAAVASLGALLIIKWAISLLISSGKYLVDYYPMKKENETIKIIVDEHKGAIVDFHLWKTCENTKAVILKIRNLQSAERKEEIIRSIRSQTDIDHLTVELV